MSLPGGLNLDAQNDHDADLLIENVRDQFKPLFLKNGYGSGNRRAIYRYLFSRRPKKLPPSLRTRVINLYDPLADRSKRFPDGFRLCLNVYTGCEHSCVYCYVNGYLKGSDNSLPHAKPDFAKRLERDINDLSTLAVPVVPLHMSNSTDICQEYLETRYRHTLLALRNISEHRQLFSSVVLLTKNPAMLCPDEYITLLKQAAMKPLVVQVTCAFWRDEVRKFYEPDAPDVASRLEALRELRKNDIDVELRIDPLFPATYIDEKIRKHSALPYYSIPETQTISDLQNLIRCAKAAGIKAVIGKPLKITLSNKSRDAKELFGRLFSDSFPGRNRRGRGGSWRLPEGYQKEMVLTLAGLCREEGVAFRHCKHDVLRRR